MKRYVRLLIILAGVILCAAAAPKSVSAASPEMHVTGKTKWIFIGDSYAVTPKSNKRLTWPYQFQERMHLRDREVCFVRLQGYGYARRGDKDLRFITAIRELPFSASVEKIVILGGINNDRGQMEYEITMEMWRLDFLLRKKFPNAKIYAGMPNWTRRGGFRRRIIKRRRRVYREYAKKLGWTYIKSMEKVLKNRKDCFLPDGHHPNAKGGRLIAQGLQRYFENQELIVPR